MKLLITAVLLLAPWALQAQEEPARFLLERVTVAGAREAAGRIIEAETLLREGESYSEEDLAQAVARVHRLPFVLDADFSLRKGSARGAYELVVEVEEARRFFFDHSVRGTVYDRPLELDRTIGSESFVASLPGLVGARQFIGRSGMVFAALDNVEGLQAGFTRYDLFGRGVVASVAYSGFIGGDICCSSEILPYSLDPSFVSWKWRGSAHRLSLEAAVPLGPADALRLGWSRRDGEGSTRSELFGRFRQGPFFVDAANASDLTLDRAELMWVRDTSDDPFVPTRGFTLSGGVEWTSFETGPLRGFRAETNYFPEPFPGQRSEQIAAVASGARHWSLSPRQTVSGLGRLSLGQTSLRNLPTVDGPLDEDLDFFGASLGLRHALRLRQSRGERGFSDFYLENTLEAGVESLSTDRRLSSVENPLERLELSTALVFRNAWGRLRFELSYLNVGEVLR